MIRPWPWFPHLVACVQIVDATPICEDGLSPGLGTLSMAATVPRLSLDPSEQAEQGVGEPLTWLVRQVTMSVMAQVL